MIRVVLIMLTVCFAFSVKAEPRQLVAGTYQDHLPVIKSYLDAHGCTPLDEALVDENQILAEYLIFCNALAESGHQYDIALVGYPINIRILDDITAGKLDASAIGIWRNEIRGNDYVYSPPLFRDNEFVKGLYTTKAKAREINTLAKIASAVTLANQNWYLDWALLECADMTLLHVGQYENMFNMLERGRGDLIPLTFSAAPDLERNQFNIPLFPVLNHKLVFPDSTHYVVSAKVAANSTLLDDLRAGMRVLRNSGAIKRIYRRLGILNERTDSWQTFKCGSTPPLIRR